MLNLPYEPNLDIRTTINYFELMEKYELGPNGAIISALNLYATKLDKFVETFEKRKDQVTHFLIDTPGQIEAFTWSASGLLFCKALSAISPTCILFIMDTDRCCSCSTFISNMLYACSIFYRFRLPIILVFNKIDLKKHDFVLDWLCDFDKFCKDAQESDNYSSSFNQSLGLVLEEFYSKHVVVGVSAMTGEGIDALLEAIIKVVKRENDLEGMFTNLNL